MKVLMVYYTEFGNVYKMAKLVAGDLTRVEGAREGKVPLKDQICIRCDQILGQEGVKGLWFTDFVMQ